VSGYLLDTNVILFTLMDDTRLSPRVRNLVASGPNLLSVASYWEVLIKSMKGKLNVGDPRIWWAQALNQLAATSIHLHPQHVEGVYSLPFIHKDPFDRILIATAIAEGLTLLTTDSEIARYASGNFQVVV
jgi:PIN domain nuclease of toxin-antitoxin system